MALIFAHLVLLIACFVLAIVYDDSWRQQSPKEYLKDVLAVGGVFYIGALAILWAVPTIIYSVFN